MRALVLAAGLGTRLRPLTEILPKPLLPVPGPTGAAGPTGVASYTLAALAGVCDAVALNLHHLPERIPAQLGREQYGLPLVYSPETTILGTLGALYPLRDFLAADDDFLLINGDSLCAWPLAELIAHHRASDADATLLVLGSEPDARLGGGLGLDERGEVVQLRRLPTRREVHVRRDFAGCHVISSALLREVPEGPGDILEGLYQKVLERGGRIESLTLEGPWHDLGDARRYLDAVADQLSWPGGAGAISSLAEIGPRVRLESALVCRDARLGAAAEVRGGVICEGAVVGPGARLERVIVAPGARVGADAAIREATVMADGRVVPFTPLAG